jgi:hypothetical protein
MAGKPYRRVESECELALWITTFGESKAKNRNKSLKVEQVGKGGLPPLVVFRLLKESGRICPTSGGKPPFPTCSLSGVHLSVIAMRCADRRRTSQPAAYIRGRLDALDQIELTRAVASY